MAGPSTNSTFIEDGFGHSRYRGDSVKATKPIVVATRTACNHTGNTKAGTVVGETYRWAHVMKTRCTELQIGFANFYPTVTSESSNANDFTIGLSLEYNGLVTRLHFQGEHLKLVSQGGFVLSDPVNRDIPVGATFFIRVFISVPVDGNVYPTSIASVSALGDGKTTGDVTSTTGALAANSGEGFAPCVIIGKPDDPNAIAFALIGDSMVGDANIDGWPIQAVQNNYGYMILSRPGSDVSTMESNSGNVYRMRLLQYATHAIVTFSANDWNLATTYAAQETLIKNLWAVLLRMGLVVYQSTGTPRSTSTDNWNTVANQTTYTGNSYNVKKNTFNSNLRNRAYPGIIPLEIAAAVEASDGIWRPAFTGDGIHPLQIGKAAILNSIARTLP